MYFVYILEARESKRYYVGQTSKLAERVKRHNNGRNLSTRYYRPWDLKWWKEYETLSEAIKVERKLKGIKKREGIERFVVNNTFRGIAQPG